jgi:mRNA-degrading endonuclease toxin of MazEF toxin-antitoxin module
MATDDEIAQFKRGEIIIVDLGDPNHTGRQLAFKHHCVVLSKYPKGPATIVVPMTTRGGSGAVRIGEIEVPATVTGQAAALMPEHLRATDLRKTLVSRTGHTLPDKIMNELCENLCELLDLYK